MAETDKLRELPDLRNREHVFADRAEAGRVLADLMADDLPSNAILLAVPAGGVPVAVEIARELNLPLDFAVVSKITPPWNPEVGYGAVAWDGTVLLNDDLVESYGLGQSTIDEGIQRTTAKVRRRFDALRAGTPMPDLSGRTAVLVDDGLASGFTMRTAVRAVRAQADAHPVIAVPTAHGRTIDDLAAKVERIYCANVRAGYRFAVASAYREWHDVSDRELHEAVASMTERA